MILSFALLALFLSSTNAAVFTGKYIVEFDKRQVSNLKKRGFDSQGDEFSHFFSQLRAQLHLDVVPIFNYSIAFNGASFYLINASQKDVEEIKSLSVVSSINKDVYTVLQPPAEGTEEKNVRNDAFVENFDFSKRASPASNASTNSSNSSAVQDAKTLLSNLPAIPWANNNSTSVYQVHQKGITGKNVVIAILDSGTDYNHEALQGKYLGGYDLVGNNYSPGSPVPNPDSDPNDTYGHGTQAAGIAVGSSNTFLGVAPGAKFRSYRILTNLDGGTTTDIVLQGLERAVNDGADVINVSAGSPEGFTFSLFNKAVDNIVAQGVIVVFAAGNYGAYGPYYSAAGSSALSSVSVGHSLTNKLVGWKSYIVSDKSSTPKEATYISVSAAVLPLDGEYAADYIPSSLCNPNGAPARQNDILIIPYARNSECAKATQYLVAAYLGYQYVFYIEADALQYLYNSAAAPKDPLKGIAAFNADDGGWISNEASKGAQFTLVFNKSISPTAIDLAPGDIPGVGLVNRVQSWGPTYDGFFNPDVTAPGGNVFAPTLNNKYVTVSGSSFSAPFVAGVAALYLEKNGYSRSSGHGASSGVPEEFKRRLMSYSTALDYYDGSTTFTGIPAPLIQQGAGMINANNALYGLSVIVDKPYFVVNSSSDRYFFQYFEFTVKNTSPNTLNYVVSSQSAAVVNTRDDTTLESFPFPPPTKADTERIYFYNPSFSLGSGASTTVRVALILDKNPPYANTCYTGKVIIQPSEGDSFGIPYLAFSENTYKNGKILIEPLYFLSYEYQPIDTSQHTFSLSDPSNMPLLSLATNFGTSDLSFDIVSSDFNVNRDSSGIITTTQCGNSNGCPKSSKYFGTLVGAFDGTFSMTARIFGAPLGWSLMPGATVNAGTYRILIRALKAFGNRQKVKDWEFQLSDPITFAA